MHELDKLAKNAAREIERSSKTSPTAAGPASKSAEPDAHLVDAINQVFSLFRINFHNQFYAAYADSDTLNQAKRLWLQSLAPFNEQTILQAAKQVIEDAEYLPTLHRFIADCDQIAFALPAARDAFIEACMAKAPYASYNWSHPLAYHAGKATGWQFLRSQPELKTFKVFQRHYEKLAKQLREGQVLALPEPPAAEADKTSGEVRPLSEKQKKKKLAELRELLAVD
ncbi:MAG: hypothetical protein HKO71_04325 [Pseudomonadales bacterium]|nr:hypothetical protein [Pseudomonadales bacterium]